MNLSLAQLTNVVNNDDKCFVDKSSHCLQIQYVATLGERLEWVLQNRKDSIHSAGHWSEKAGLSRQAVATAIRRDSGMRTDNIEALAAAAGVDFNWLATGRGQPDKAESLPEKDPYPNRQIAATRARQAGAIESAIMKARSLHGVEFENKSSAAWSELIFAISNNELKRSPKTTEEIVRALAAHRATDKRHREREEERQKKTDSQPKTASIRRKASG